jgi:MOSC domain-containing protein YiiM
MKGARTIRIDSVNAGRIAPIDTASGRSAIHKHAIEGPVMVTRDGLIGDEIGNRGDHGGADQAIYCYCADDLAHFEGLLERHLPPGMFGENLTLSGVTTADVAIGDRLTNGRTVLEVTSPRTPCATFAAHMREPRIVKWFAQSLRTGFYTRVITEGTVKAGETLDFIPFAGDRVPVTEMMRWYLEGSDADPALRRRLLAAPINERWRGFVAGG